VAGTRHKAGVKISLRFWHYIGLLITAKVCVVPWDKSDAENDLGALGALPCYVGDNCAFLSNMTSGTLVNTLLAARLENQLGWHGAMMNTWSDETRTDVLNTVFERLRTVHSKWQVMLYQVGRAVAFERPARFANRVLAAGGSDELLVEVCWSVEGWTDSDSVPLLVDLVRSDRSVAVKRQALMTLLHTQHACVPAILSEVAAWVPASPQEQELVAFIHELQHN
jgi:hypothetical protein